MFIYRKVKQKGETNTKRPLASRGPSFPPPLGLFHPHRTCSDRPEDVLVFAQRSNLRMIPLNGTLEDNLARTDTVVPVDGVESAVALDFYTEDDIIFWTDIEAKTISRAHLNGSLQTMVVRNVLGECGFRICLFACLSVSASASASLSLSINLSSYLSIKAIYQSISLYPFYVFLFFLILF